MTLLLVRCPFSRRAIYRLTVGTPRTTLERTVNPTNPQPQHVHSLRPKKRSAIPKVLGILAIVFSAFGLLFSIVQTFGTYGDIDDAYLDPSELGSFATWIPTYMVFAVILFGVHLTAGILSTRYSPRAIKWMNGYANFAILLALANISITTATYPDALKVTDGHMGRIVLDIFALPWPIIVLSMMNLRSVRLACSDAFNQKIPKAKIAQP